MSDLKEFRCKFCHRLLAKVAEAKKVEIKCPKCKTLNLYNEDVITIVEISEDYLRKRFSRGKVECDVVSH
ncbi:MAG: Com family DNA-binding transcriptional regulator [Candidatus Saganbacteria bacterium]|nr:Com family DNA-binding transcriptional regulator [Candidatus Saganbacteria bacterium]